MPRFSTVAMFLFTAVVVILLYIVGEARTLRTSVLQRPGAWEWVDQCPDATMGDPVRVREHQCILHHGARDQLHALEYWLVNRQLAFLFQLRYALLGAFGAALFVLSVLYAHDIRHRDETLPAHMSLNAACLRIAIGAGAGYLAWLYVRWGIDAQLDDQSAQAIERVLELDIALLIPALAGFSPNLLIEGLEMAFRKWPWRIDHET